MRPISQELESRIIEACNACATMAKAHAEVAEMHYNTFTRHAKRLGVYKPNPGGKGISKTREGTPLSEILEGKHPHYQTYKLKHRLFAEGLKENKSESCGIEQWLGQSIALELDHIDGDSTNHVFSNLQVLCPNCHSLTPTFRARNIARVAKR